MQAILFVYFNVLILSFMILFSLFRAMRFIWFWSEIKITLIWVSTSWHAVFTLKSFHSANPFPINIEFLFAMEFNITQKLVLFNHNVIWLVTFFLIGLWSTILITIKNKLLNHMVIALCIDASHVVENKSSESIEGLFLRLAFNKNFTANNKITRVRTGMRYKVWLK